MRSTDRVRIACLTESPASDDLAAGLGDPDPLIRSREPSWAHFARFMGSRASDLCHWPEVACARVNIERRDR